MTTRKSVIEMVLLLGCLSGLLFAQGCIFKDDPVRPDGCTSEECASGLAVLASVPWTSTGETVSGGCEVTVTGQWSMGQGGCVDADGEENIAGGGYPVPGEPAACLVGKVGDGAPFRVRSGETFTISGSGELYLGGNEAAAYRGNETGALCCEIEVDCDGFAAN
ncbi:MAG: hypothetical protein KAY24_08025 [Candidatus Eisenbacteria sp.]|nr:hypothetical protein [Candidatus Eisenbacteria bacterium]